jgi:hypothetical protein
MIDGATKFVVTQRICHKNMRVTKLYCIKHYVKIVIRRLHLQDI